MVDLPKLALSVRQPWAHCLMMGWKPVENRSWRAGNPGLNFRGDFAIHASTGMTRDEYADCADLCQSLGFQCPPPAELERGGIVGVGTIVDIVTQFDSPWFFGPKGLVIADACPVEFIPVGGQLGFFDWKRLVPFAKNGKPVVPAKWMLAQAPKAATSTSPLDTQGSLL
ncbi:MULTISPECIES: hypothetical protein [unclassified Mesorhizobium]|uniref:hypothetical protein n=1 Tax=unclassified Mesorhizobium TaxID=325217 RepID=UPI0007FCE09E|nr:MULTISPECIES: hypothetical protein [unclassified Mesorhizobium]OBQ84688.1 hypothetical protein A9K71_21875 [Mesorhizobium sp. WSM3873]